MSDEVQIIVVAETQIEPVSVGEPHIVTVEGRGAQGVTGPVGPQGAAGDPGTVGPQGPPGVSATKFTALVDVGSLPAPNAVLTFPHAGLAAGTSIVGYISTEYPGTKNPDEWEMDCILVRLRVEIDDVVTAVIRPLDGSIAGEFNVDYYVTE